MDDKNFFHVVIASDSLSLPRPWNQKNLQDSPESFFRIDQTYPFLLKKKLTSLMDEEVIVSNYAVRGSSIQRPSGITPDLFSWMSSDISIIHHGIVDCWLKDDGETRIPKSNFTDYVKKIMEDKLRWGPKTPLIVIGMLPTNERMLSKNARQNDVIHEFNEVLREHIRSDVSIFMDMEKFDEADKAKMVHEDGHHLSRYGHMMYAEHLCENIKKLCGINLPEMA
ncbi:GDSL-type esterase/lipase family protein [Legionella sp. CNM-4043-24]|uniref:GDSL-type esterase/lipase family protein n=1 Tax=Legionella sp. CNM-4043-24 TaxID=3421646 RepID=UPI00403A8D30